jgi:anti-sigma B factor antagonist
VQVTGIRLSSERRGDSLVLAIGGELDIVTSRQLDEHLTRSRREYRRIVLDLSAVEFMDTSSLAVIVGHWKRLQAAGGTLVLAGARYRYTKTLWITGLADRLPLYDSVDEALAAGEAAAGEPAAAEPAAAEPAAAEPAVAEPAAGEGAPAPPEGVPPAARRAAGAGPGSRRRARPR